MSKEHPETNPHEPINIVPAMAGRDATFGLTKREQFAAMAMQAIVTARPNNDNDEICLRACEIADMLLCVLNEETDRI